MLNRTLKYYVDNGFLPRIIVVDSSNKEASKLTKTYVDNVSDILDIDYISMSEDTEFGDKLYKASLMVESPYLIIIPDDDMVTKSGIMAAIKHIKNNDDVVAAYGDRLSIAATAPKSKEFNSWIQILPYYAVSIDKENPLNRIRQLSVPSWPQYLYSVYKTKAFVSSISVIKGLKYTQFTEFFFYAAILAHGKWEKISDFFALCNVDSSHYSLRDRNSYPHYWNAGKEASGSIEAQISQPFWSSHVLIMSSRLEGLFSDKVRGDNIDLSNTLRKIYFAINNKYLEKNGQSYSLVDDSQHVPRIINKFRMRVNSIFWMFILPDQENGIYIWLRMLRGLLKEIFIGRFFRVLSSNFSLMNIRRILVYIKRFGSLEYETSELLRPKSRHNKNFIPLFNAWINNPCPKVYTSNSKESGLNKAELQELQVDRLT
jgi:glycosyltransferase domain-containing protein